MKLMSVKDVAKKWGITQHEIEILCLENRINDAKFDSNTWFIPVSTEKMQDDKTISFKPATSLKAKPFLKWAGGKSKIINDIRNKYPNEIGIAITKYAEPFVGGGAVLFDILNNYNIKEAYISDINKELIQTYITIRDNIDEIICTLKANEKKYLNSNDDIRKEIYYTARERFNILKLNRTESVELASLFIFLNKTCFNGLYRVNSRGLFNVPQGSYKNPNICDEGNLQAVSKILQGVIIRCVDYKESINFIDNKTFAYFDPPYRPLTKTASFTSYVENGFGDKEQIELANFIDKLSDRNVLIALSNSDAKNIDSTDDFFDRLYCRHIIERIKASRSINSVGGLRGKINELLITNNYSLERCI